MAGRPAAKPSKLKNFFGFGKKEKEPRMDTAHLNMTVSNPPKCMMGHAMNRDPITNLQQLEAIHREIETLNKLQPGQLRLGSYFCDGPSCLN
mmetsp:Transcript_4516/g.6804  ORF Transcript_4516/g.6804 Transcript_4516/m.6804 type:complete len:92 (+) Transcript_4516:1161-1436(+)